MGVLYPFVVLVGMNFKKTQVPSYEHKRVLYATLHKDWFGDYRSLRFLGVDFGQRLFCFLMKIFNVLKEKTHETFYKAY